ncbi:hypothetical protein HN51_012033 [Arachis hypogaea]|uniref:ditrans,polycis-polyprenyl diphosphate synthase [(2E,6E)-farnesyldiphosphate specific] n=2 Tax=Arachis duranensis TaxID=130453 RepID=A0A6P4CPL3_ARADU|nr:uncharacterized protein LOC107478935 isoform X1 [Arachis duranensis]XP_025688665.1 dehydrodolichyl diphosphate synthase complex subunit NUS1 isoform X1 [Arachis hypogaea]XP_057727162.1 uncharacterized protein LOC130943336 [Arachis stenosperma]QHO57448.1 Dehydrodolichyl diphosphate syntase complex subunit [Arachis hypogaea]
MDLKYPARKLSRSVLTMGNVGLQLLWYFLHILLSIWHSILAIRCFIESCFITCGVLEKYKSLNIAKLRYLAIVIESEDAHQTSKVVKLLQWLDSIGVKNVCLYDMNGVLKKSKEAIFGKLKNAKPIEEVNEAVTLHVPEHMTLEFVSYADGKEAMVKAANFIFVENLKRQNFGGEIDGQVISEPLLNEALKVVGCKGPEPDLLLVYGPVRSHLGFPAWRIRYTEIVHMGSLNFLRYGSLIKAIYDFTKVHQNYGT